MAAIAVPVCASIEVVVADADTRTADAATVFADVTNAVNDDEKDYTARYISSTYFPEEYGQTLVNIVIICKAL